MCGRDAHPGHNYGGTKGIAGVVGQGPERYPKKRVFVGSPLSQAISSMSVLVSCCLVLATRWFVVVCSLWELSMVGVVEMVCFATMLDILAILGPWACIRGALYKKSRVCTLNRFR